MVQGAALAILHGAALLVVGFTEHESFAIALAVLSWLLLNFCWMLLVRRPAVAAAMSLAMIGGLIVLSQFKWGITYMTATALDLLIIDTDTVAFLTSVFPRLRWWIAGALVIGIPLLVLLWRIDRVRTPRWIAAGGALGCFAVIVPLS